MDIAIIGGGASATALLCALGRRRPEVAGPHQPAVTVFEERPRVGPGVPYRTPDPWHRMNVRARDLSIDGADPEAFVRWLAEVTGRPPEPASFVARGLYGRYLASEAARWTVGGTTVQQQRVRGLRPATVGGPGWVLDLADGLPVRARLVVLAVGLNPGAARACTVDAPAAATGRVVTRPWEPGALAVLRRCRRVVVVGAGLTAVDVVLTLLGAGDHGPEVVVVSPSGRLPEVHDVAGARPVGELPALPPGAGPDRSLTARQVLGWARQVVQGEPVGWRAGVDALRPHSQAVWRRLPPEERARLLRLVGDRWYRHRHRMAPQAGGTIDRACRSGRLSVARGRVERIALDDRGCLEARLADGGARHADGVAVCCGFETRVDRTTDPLVAGLLQAGQVRPDALGRGLATDEVGRARSAGGATHPDLFVLGGLRRGDLIEATAIPDLRTQAAGLAPTLLAALGRRRDDPGGGRR